MTCKFNNRKRIVHSEISGHLVLSLRLSSCWFEEFSLIHKMDKYKRPPSFKIEVPCDVSLKHDVLQKLKTIRENLTQKLNRPVNNYDVINAALNFWIENNIENKHRHLIIRLAEMTQMRTCLSLHHLLLKGWFTFHIVMRFTASRRLSAIVFYVHFLKTWENRVHSLQPLNKFEKPIWIKYLHCKSCK